MSEEEGGDRGGEEAFRWGAFVAACVVQDGGHQHLTLEISGGRGAVVTCLTPYRATGWPYSPS